MNKPIRRAGLARTSGSIRWPHSHKPIRGKPYPPKGDNQFHILWRLVDGAVLDTMNNHPDYFRLNDPSKGFRAYDIRMSLDKRVVGALMGYLRKGRVDPGNSRPGD